MEGCSSKVIIEMFNLSEENIVLHKNMHTALVLPINIKDTEQREEKPSEKEKSSVR